MSFIYHPSIGQVDLPFRPDSFAAFVTLADLTIGDDHFQVDTSPISSHLTRAHTII